MTAKLKTLYELQIIDDKLDHLEELRGDLPRAVNELTYKMAAMKEQIVDKEKEQKKSIAERDKNEEEIEKFKTNQKKFKSQLYQVRNNKEYDALTKEIDHAEDKIKELSGRNRELENAVQKLKAEIEDIQPKLAILKDELKEKETSLKEIIKSNEKEESKLKDYRTKLESQIKRPDYSTYMRIRKAKGGKAIAVVVRSACSGCNNVVPPQRQLEIKQNKRVFSCEYCGRILISSEIAENSNGHK